MRNWLKELRGSKTQSEFAKSLGIAATTLASYEQGARNPSVDQAKKLGKKLGVDWTIFFAANLRNTSKIR